jgi:ATP-dependent DNA helicase 2 subunit 2
MSFIGRGKRGYAAKRVLLFTNAATPFSDHSLKVILDSLKQQDIIVDAIGPTWGQDDEENDRPDSPMQTNDQEENTASARPTTNGHQNHRSPKKPLTQQQQTGIRVINEIVNTTEGSLFTFR